MMKYFRYHHTNCFFIENVKGKLLAFDAGWPCTLNEYKRMMKSIGLKYEDIEWAIVSHMHMDHAGLLGEFIKDGIKCFAFENQVEAIGEMERIILKGKEYQSYLRIEKDKLKSIGIYDFNEKLSALGIGGKIVRTIGHTTDSISYITDNHEALIGDLYPVDLVMNDDVDSLESWNTIIGLGVEMIYPSHAEEFEI